MGLSSSYYLPKRRLLWSATNSLKSLFLASLERLPSLPQATHSGDIRSDYKAVKSWRQLTLLEPNIAPVTTVKDAISDLPTLEAGQAYDHEIYPREPETIYQQKMREQSQKIVNHIAPALTPIQMSRVQILAEGQDARDLPAELAPKKHYSGAYGRLSWDKPARTITRWFFHPGSGRFFHPTQNRTITIREAARLHSYPDHFHFLGTYTDTASQIGESVPPLLGKVVADSMGQNLEY